MKKIMLSFMATITVATFISGPVFAATTYINQSDIDVASVALSSLNTFTTSISDTSVPISTVVSNANLAEQDLDNLTFHKFNTDLGTAYTQSATALKADAALLNEDVKTLVPSIKANDTSAINTELVTYNADITKFNTDSSGINSAVDKANSSNQKTHTALNVLYLILLILSILLSVGTFVWAFIMKGPDVLRQKQKRKLAYISIAPVVGAGITFATFYFASKNGGVYDIAWGPIIFGVIAYAGGLRVYLSGRTAGGDLNQSPSFLNAAPAYVPPVPVTSSPAFQPPNAPYAPMSPSPSSTVPQESYSPIPAPPEPLPVQPQTPPVFTPPTPPTPAYVPPTPVPTPPEPYPPQPPVGPVVG